MVLGMMDQIRCQMLIMKSMQWMGIVVTMVVW